MSVYDKYQRLFTFGGTVTNLIADKAEAVVPSDTTVVDYNSLYVGIGGSLVVTLKRGGTVTYTNVPDGTFMSISVVKVWAATDANNIIGHKI